MRPSTSSSSTSSAYTSAGDAARSCTGHEGGIRYSDAAENVGTAWLLGSQLPRDRSNEILDRLKIDK